MRSTSCDPLVEHLFRTRSGQMVAWLTRVFGPGHLGLAEEVVQDALIKALQQWPRAGVPDNPGAWLLRVARNGALDALRRHAAFRDRMPQLEAELLRAGAASGTDFDETIRDDELRMVFMCCHPALGLDAGVALSLKTVGGFGVGEIARAFLCAEATVAQRLVRAKRLLRERGMTLDLPPRDELPARLAAVLEVIYLLFNEGYSARTGADLIRIDLCAEALRMARLVADAPATSAPDAHALAALIALQSARLPARVDAAGEIVLFDDQDRARWDHRLIALGFAHLEKSAEGPRETPYHVQAAIAAQYARADTAAGTPWPDILRLYDRLMTLAPTPIVALNRAAALWKVAGPSAALEAVAAIEHARELDGYYLLPAVQARLYAELGDHSSARRFYERALAQPCSEPERRLLQRRMGELPALV